MKLWHFLFGETGTEKADSLAPLELDINPANGLPMIQGTTIDIEGNAYGTDSQDFGVTGFDIGTGLEDI